MKRSALILAVLVSLALPATAGAKQYVLKHPKHEHCRAHYTRKVEHVKRHEHGRTVKVRETVCVYVAPKPVKTVAPATTPAATTPAPIVKLHAHLDPTFTQDPANPLIVTFDYSASAEQQSGAVTVTDPALPAGVLAFYSEGLLACSMNVGGSTAGGECTIDYSAFGAHTINAIYTSGEASATTGSETVEVEPPPIIPTVTTQTASGSCSEQQPYTFIELVCHYTVGISTIAQGGEARTEDRSIKFEGKGAVEVALKVPADEDSCQVEVVEQRPTDGITVNDHPVKVRSSECGNAEESWPTNYASSWSVTSVYAGQPGPLSAPLGWAASQSESVLLWSE